MNLIGRLLPEYEVLVACKLANQRYYDKPEIKEKRRIDGRSYRERPEIQEHYRIHGQRYRQVPENIKRKKLWQREYDFFRQLAHSIQTRYARSAY